MSVAQWEREAIGERTKTALQHKISNGERCGKIRYGYNLADDGVSLVLNATEQETIELITELRNEELSLRKIATELTQRGIPTKEGNSAWTHTAVKRILNRPAA